MDRTLWLKWKDKINARGLNVIALTVLDGAGPIRFLLSQCILGLTPFLSLNDDSSWKAFADLLEDPQESKSFAEFLRQVT